MAYHDDDDKEKDELPEGVLDEVLDEKDEDEDEDEDVVDPGLMDDEKAWE